MAIKDILAIVDTGDKDEQFLRDALAFAEFHSASLSLVVLSALPSADYALTVRRRDIWHRSGRGLAESEPRLGGDVRRRACGEASGDIRWFFA